ncbi:MAG: hypothetical protein M3461_01640 [Pseudomonadota bacterium]|nr:hypothetical protein [Pseudomonadota bacterium]
MATFLRAINALENIRVIDASLHQALAATAPTGKTGWKKYLGSAKDEIADAIQVLEAKRLHPTAVASLKVSWSKMKSAMKTNTPAQKDQKDSLTTEAISNEHAARGDICEAGSDAVLCP